MPASADVALVICHEPFDSLRKRGKDLLRHRPNARVLLVSSGAATLESARDLAEPWGVPGRLFGAAVNQSVQELAEHWSEAIHYLKDNQITSWTERFFGLEIQATRMVVRLALEVARWELGRGSPSDSPSDLPTLLDPVAALAKDDADLGPVLAGLVSADMTASNIGPTVEAALQELQKRFGHPGQDDSR